MDKATLTKGYWLAIVLVGLGAGSAIGNSGSNDHTVSDWKQALRQPVEWYASPEAERIAENVLAHQRDSGGWPKNTNMARVLDDAEVTNARRERSNNDSTIDNGATTSQLSFLSRVATATGDEEHRQAVVKGVDFLLEAQYDNGGWPMFYPPKRGYYEHITFNDGATIAVLEVLSKIAKYDPAYSFIEPEQRELAASAVENGIEAILACQIVVDGKPTVWCAQHDRETLKPAKARSYELPSLSGNESVDVVRFLMEIEAPNARVIASIEGAAAWFDEVKILGLRPERVRNPAGKHGYDVVVRQDLSAPPLWARFYEIGTNQPMFVGRDGVVKRSLAEIEIERRTGYTYLGSWGEKLLTKDYPEWQQRVKSRREQPSIPPSTSEADSAG